METVIIFAFIGGLLGSFLATAFSVYWTIKGADKKINNLVDMLQLKERK